MSLQKKFLLALLVVISLSFFGLTVYFVRHESRQHLEEEMQTWQELGESIVSNWKTTMRWTGSDNLARDQLFDMKDGQRILAIRLARNPKLTRINPQSSPYVSTELEKQVLAQVKPCSEILSEGSQGQLLIIVPITAEKVCVTCHQKINNHSIKEGEVMAVLSLTTSLKNTYAKIAADQRNWVISFSGVLLLLLLIVRWIVRNLTGPLKSLTIASQKIAQGNLAVRVNVPTRDELGVLANSFNHMAEKLQQSHAILEQRVKERTQELATLNAVAFTVSQSLELEQVLKDALDKVLEALEVDAGSIYLLSEENRLIIHAHRGLSEPLLREMDNYSLGFGMPGQVAKSCLPLTAEDLWTDPRVGKPAVLKSEGFRSFVGVPLVSKSRVVGVLALGSKTQRKFLDTELQLLTSIGQQIGVAVENAQLFQETIQNKKNWETTFDSIGDLIWVQDLDYTIRRANKAAVQKFDTNPESLVGKKCYEVFCRSDRPVNGCPFLKMNKTGKVEVLEIDNSHLQETFSVSTDPIFDAGGSLIGCVHIAKDITEDKRLREMLQQSEKLSAMGELVAGVAHELNSPLSGVIGLSALLLEENLPSEVRKDVESIQEQGLRCQKIVKNLLIFARKYKPERTRVDLNAVIQSVLDLKNYELTVDNIGVITEFDQKLPSALADFHQMQQVFLNLVNNAHQAMAEAKGRGTLRVKTVASGDCIRALVIDDGPGISRENLSKIFNPFFTTKDAGKGTGLGLSLCYGILQEHEGKIWAESQEGHGATFVVELPIKDAADLQLEESAAEKRDQRTRVAQKILVVDDEKVVAEVMRRILERDGHQIEVVARGDEALQRIQHGEYDLIFCDLKMPGMDGQRFFEVVKREDKELARRIVFMSGDTVSRETSVFLEQAGNVYLEKPFTAEKLRAVMNLVLGPH